jgi:SAM-dependent methyltransferase
MASLAPQLPGSAPRVPAALVVTVTVRHPLCARLYAQQAERAEGLGLAERRRGLLEGLSGRVLEIGAGTGTNLAHYPPAVAEVVALEPEPYLRQRLSETAQAAPVEVTVVDAAAEVLPFADAAFDAAVSCLVLCSVADPVRALAELRRALRPGGELRFLEHVASPHPRRRRLQRAADATLWPLLSGGCHLGRDTTQLIADAGFAIERCERFAFGIPPLDPPKTHVLGVARAPAT